MAIETGKLLSPEPNVKLLAFTQVPHGDFTEDELKILLDPRVIAGESARTCYSSILFEPKDYLNNRHRGVTDDVIVSTRKSGHLTTREHVNFTFGISGVSRQLIWSLLHAHPHYNSDQQSQRYVTMKAGNFLVPDLPGEASELYQATIEQQMQAYQQLGALLRGPAEAEYFRIFSNRGRQREKWQGEIQKKAQEVARYILPVATHANLYHTVSSLTLMRLVRACDQYDAPTEAKILVSKMVKAVTEQAGEGFLEEISDPIPLDETPEARMLAVNRRELDYQIAKRAILEFDSELGGRTSNLLGYTSNAWRTLGLAVRNVAGLTSRELDDDEAIRQLLNPKYNDILGEVANITKLSKLSRALETVTYTVAKRISHTADSQDQRHRMTPAARPILATHYTGEPDYVTPALVQATPEAEVLYRQVMEQSWEAVNELLGMGVSFENAAYLLPNALAIRLVEQGTLLNLHHKYRMRLCFNAQEEIWRASCEEAEQIEEVHPEIGAWLLPPCGVRYEAQSKPFCPEGSRFCGVKVWQLPRGQYQRLI